MHISELMPSLQQLVDYDYQAIQNQNYDDYIAALLQTKSPSSHPHFVQISGIPASGKSTFIATNNFNDYLFISFDAIMVAMPAYQQDVKNFGAEQAFKNWEMPARVIGYHLLAKALEKRINIVFEHSGANDAHIELFQSLPKLGYQTKIHFLLCDIEVAFQRALERQKATNRHTSKEIIIQRAALLNEYLQKYQSFVDVSIHNTVSKQAA